MAVLSACPWDGLDYLVDGKDAGAPDGSDGGPALDASIPDAPDHFKTLAPGERPPSEATCAAWVGAHPTKENIPSNSTANQTQPTAAWLVAFHANPINTCSGSWCADLATVSGAFAGTTDMVLRWAACKWGIDEDIARVLAAQKSSWQQSTTGNDDTICHSRNVDPGALNYWSEPSPCRPSKGILQVKLVYANAAPFAMTSTSLNADVSMASMRACMNGHIAFLATAAAGPFGPYPPTDPDDALWGCVGFGYSGQWGDTDAATYVQQVKALLMNRSWPQ